MTPETESVKQPTRRRYIYRDGKMVDISFEPRNKVTTLIKIGASEGWNTPRPR